MEVAWKIVQNGFSNLSILDAGYYGRGTIPIGLLLFFPSFPLSLSYFLFLSKFLSLGMYFATSASYSLPYYGSKSDPALFVCLAITGTPSALIIHHILTLHIIYDGNCIIF